jgi:hypothetical protein
MSGETQHERSPLDPKEIQLLETLSSFDQAQQELLEACTDFAQQPSETNKLNVGNHGSLVLRTFNKSVETILANVSGEGEQIDAISQLIVQGDERRVNFLKELTGCDEYSVVTAIGEDDEPSEMSELLREMWVEAPSKEIFIEAVLAGFGNCLNGDINHFASDILSNYEVVPAEEEKASETSPSRAKQLGGHALEVGKISAGVVIGTWLARRLKII